MRKLLSGALLSATLLMGAGPLVEAAHANPSSTDPVLCFVASQAIITEALNSFHAGNITISDLRTVLVGTASFLGDCLTPIEQSVTPPIVIPPVVPPVVVPPISLPTTLPGFPNITLPTIPTVNVPSS